MKTFKCQRSIVDISADPILVRRSQHLIAANPSWKLGINLMLIYSNHYNKHNILWLFHFERKGFQLWGTG